MTAREDQPQPVVFHTIIVQVGGGRHAVAQALGDGHERSIEPGAPPQLVDRLEAARRDQPRARIAGHALGRPALHRRREGFLQRLLGEIEIAEQADQRREDPARLGAVDRLDGIA